MWKKTKMTRLLKDGPKLKQKSECGKDSKNEGHQERLWIEVGLVWTALKKVPIVRGLSKI